MAKRNLKFVKRSARETVGVCDTCNAQFKSFLPQPDKAEWEITTRFDEHTCKQESASQTAARISKELADDRQN